MGEGVCIELFHGRKDPMEDLDGWGDHGPVFGPYQFVHTTYTTELKMETFSGDLHVLELVDDMVYYDGMFYGDWSVFRSEILRAEPDLRDRLKRFDEKKAVPKRTSNRKLLTVTRSLLQTAIDAVNDRCQDFMDEVERKFPGTYGYTSDDLSRAMEVLEAVRDGRSVSVKRGDKVHFRRKSYRRNR